MSFCNNMGKIKNQKQPEAIWEKHCHDYLGSEIYTTGFPSLYGTSISVSTFPPKKILTLGEVLKDFLSGMGWKRQGPLLVCEDHADNQRFYVFSNSEADTKLSLNCCFEGDCGDWDANSAFFRRGELTAVVSEASLTEKDRKHTPSKNDIEKTDYNLLSIYKSEIRRLARNLLHYEGKGDPYKEFISILKAKSHFGQGLHDSYRESIEEILRGSLSD